MLPPLGNFCAIIESIDTFASCLYALHRFPLTARLYIPSNFRACEPTDAFCALAALGCRSPSSVPFTVHKWHDSTPASVTAELPYDTLMKETKYCHGTHGMPPPGTKMPPDFILPCYTSFEQAYMDEHAAELKRGLELLRAPGCFPHGVYVVAAGYVDQAACVFRGGGGGFNAPAASHVTTHAMIRPFALRIPVISIVYRALKDRAPEHECFAL
jgi:hypothetical protein